MNKAKLNFSIPQLIRRIVQLVAFILMPGLFISIFGAFKDVFTALLQGSFSYSALSYQLWLLVAVIPITVLMGRFFCGYLCSFGAMGDFLWFLSCKLRIKTPVISERTDNFLKKLKYVVLSLIVVLIWTLGLVTFSGTESPWTIFGMYASFSGWPSAAGLISAGAALLLLIMIGSMLIERFFCRYLCPLGAIFSIFSKPRLIRIKKPRTSCGACTLCTQKCTMGILLSQADEISSGECINCFQCVDACPRHNVKVNPTPALAATVATGAIAGMCYIGDLSAATASTVQATISTGAVADSSDTSDSSVVYDYSGSTSTGSSVSESAIASGSFTDGVYTGTGTGFRGDTTVSVTVSGGVITSITTVSYADDAPYFNRAKNTVISSIISQQSIDVSTVSGATFSSNGIIEAVANALSVDFTNPNSTLSRGHSR